MRGRRTHTRVPPPTEERAAPPSPPPAKLARFSPISVHFSAITYLASWHNLLSTLINLELTLESGLLGECGRADGALERLLLGVDDGVRAQVGRAPEALGCKTYMTSADVLAFASDIQYRFHATSLNSSPLWD